MKTLILILSFVIPFMITTSVIASPATGLLNAVPDEQPAQSELSLEMSDIICKMVGANGMRAQINKNEGISLEESLQGMKDAYNAGNDGSEPGQVSFEISLGAITAVYAEDIQATTQDELVELGTNLYNVCRGAVDKIQWEVVE